MLDKIPEAKAIRAWNLARKSKEKEANFVPNKPPRKSVNPYMSINPFKFKQGRRREPKNDHQCTKKKKKKKKKKGRRQPLVLHKQQLCKYHHPIVYPLVYPEGEPVMAITVDPIIVPPSKITSISTSWCH